MKGTHFLRASLLPVSSGLHRWLLMSSCFSCALLFVRISVTGSPGYLFLPWNLFLAFIPYWITGWMMRNLRVMENRIKLILSLTGWLLFIPNSFYIITDFFHLGHFGAAPKWFDLLLIFSFAWNGMIYGIVSLRRVEIIAGIHFPGKFSGIIVFAVMWLSAFGVYIGRFLRFNSWDIITDPFSLMGEIMAMILHPADHSYAWGMTGCYAVFMTFLYILVKKLGEYFITVK